MNDVTRQETPDVLHWLIGGESDVGVVFTKTTRDIAVT